MVITLRQRRVLTISILCVTLLAMTYLLRVAIEQVLWSALHLHVQSPFSRAHSHPQTKYRSYNKFSSGVLLDTVPLHQRIQFYSQAHGLAVQEQEKVSDPALQRYRFNQGFQTKELEYCMTRLPRRLSDPLDTPPDTPPLLTLFTTINPSKKDPLKTLAQENMLESFAYLRQYNVKGILFTDDDAWIQRATKLGIQVIRGFSGNQYGVPYLHDMYLQAMNHHPNSYFYAYTNADILFTSSIVSTLCALRGSIESSDSYTLRRRVLIVGRRSNYNLQINDTIRHSYKADEMREKTDSFYEHSTLFTMVAEDYFVVTKWTFNWNEMPRFIIGRVGYDNCLVSQAIVDRGIDTIDATKTIRAIHMTGLDGNFAGHKRHKDQLWNLQRCLTDSTIGSTDRCEFYTSWEKISLTGAASGGDRDKTIQFWPNSDVGYVVAPNAKKLYQQKLVRLFGKDAKNVDAMMNVKGGFKMVEVSIRQRHFKNIAIGTKHPAELSEHDQHALVVKRVSSLLYVVLFIVVVGLIRPHAIEWGIEGSRKGMLSTNVYDVYKCYKHKHVNGQEFVSMLVLWLCCGNCGWCSNRMCYGGGNRKQAGEEYALIHHQV
jgi:hypothetical protein